VSGWAFNALWVRGLANLNLETAVYRECIANETWSFRFVYVTLFVLALTFTPHLWS
jgi:hypothetical protein